MYGSGLEAKLQLRKPKWREHDRAPKPREASTLTIAKIECLEKHENTAVLRKLFEGTKSLKGRVNNWLMCNQFAVRGVSDTSAESTQP